MGIESFAVETVPNIYVDAGIEVILAFVAGPAGENQIVAPFAAARRTRDEMIARRGNMLFLQLWIEFRLHAAVSAFFLPVLVKNFEFHGFPRLRKTSVPDIFVFRAQAFKTDEKKWRSFGRGREIFPRRSHFYAADARPSQVVGIAAHVWDVQLLRRPDCVARYVYSTNATL